MSKNTAIKAISLAPQIDGLPPNGEARYEPAWERLADALDRVMAATGLSKAEAQKDICSAIADGNIKIRCRLREHASQKMTSKDVLPGDALQIPTSIKPSALDWDASRPVTPWFVSRGAYCLPGKWHLAGIELLKADVTKVLCRVVPQAATQLVSDQSAAVVVKAAVDSNGSPLAGGAGRRGRRVTKLLTTMDAMEGDLQKGLLTRAALATMVEKQLAPKYGVSRDTARKARNAVLSKLSK